MTHNLAYEPKSAWEVSKNPGQRLQMRLFADQYLKFISQCKTERETIDCLVEKLEKNGFSENGDKIFRNLRGKTLFAARRGRRPLSDGARLIAAHIDAPRLDFKQHPFIEQAGIAQAKTHYYGGIKKYQWLARPLALHGVIIHENGKKTHVQIGEDPNDPVFSIADLLPHLAQKQNGQKVSEAFEGEKLNVILGHIPENSDDSDKAKEPVKKAILNILHSRYGVSEEDFITAELEAVPAGEARFVGLDQSLLGGYGQDDRICAWCAMEAFLAAKEPEYPLIAMFWDKEETGSDGASGASSQFFLYCMEELSSAWQAGPVSKIMLETEALCADVTAALDPDYQDAHEKNNAARLGYGCCFSKFTGSRGKYGTSEADAEFFSKIRRLLNAKNIPWQAAELGKVDTGGGGTVALFMARYGMKVIDFGPPLLSMHSPFELSSVADLYSTWQAYLAFYEDK